MAMSNRLQMLKQLKRFQISTTFNHGNRLMATSSNKDVVPTEFNDVETHTGQTFEKDDYRLSRFIGNKKKKVNTRFAIDLIAEIPPKPVNARFVMCDGGGGPLGHPNVFINLDQPGNHSCGYCGLRFYQDGHDHGHGH
ncbi:hypothetical protein RDWZM_006560 [Blomia tropicalis]|uniref:Zinc finger CHCC-type domain-containing protein n=1 Tax=Blomia tropicalis TaxID=40697 RepID=A0A9Q0RLV8_BLOTA|nr:hypothetical protein RDWZM_006560 [Blomia tropicalis]